MAIRVHEVPSSELLATARLDPGEADLLFGGPPCQPFSKAGYWASGDSRRLDDPRADTVAAFLRVLRDTRPRAFLMENVAGLAFRGKDEGLRLIQQTAAILELSTQALEGPTILDLDSATRSGNRPIPLEKPSIIGKRALPRRIQRKQAVMNYRRYHVSRRDKAPLLGFISDGPPILSRHSNMPSKSGNDHRYNRVSPSYKDCRPATPASSRTKQRNRKKDTAPELLLRRTLWRRGPRYRLHAKGLPGTPDLIFGKPKLAVFVDGDFWHGRDWKARKEKLSKGSNPDYWIRKISYNKERDLENNAKLI